MPTRESLHCEVIVVENWYGTLRPRHVFDTLPDGTLDPPHVIMALTVAHDGTIYTTTTCQFTLMRIPAIS